MKLLLFVSLSIYAYTTLAQTPETKSLKTKTDTLPQKLEELVVTAQRTDSDPFKTPEAIQFIGLKQLQNYQARTTPEALSNINGVFVQKTNHGGGSPFIRGLTGNQTLLLIDGIRLNNATFRYGPNQYFNTIDPLSIERIEVMLGSGSVQYGSDAIGGTIQVLTINPEFSEKARASGSLTSRFTTQNMEQTGRSVLGYSNSRIAFRGGLSYRHYGDLIGGDTTGKQTPSGYKELNFDVKSRFLISKRGILTLSHQNVKQSGVPLYHRLKLENYSLYEFNPQKRQLSYARLDWESENPFFKKIYAVTSLQQTEEGRNIRQKGSSVLRIENDKVRSWGFSANILSRFKQDTEGGYSAISGIEFYHDFVKSQRVDKDESQNTLINKRGLYPNDSYMINFSMFTLHQYNCDKWQFSGGLRWNGFNVLINDEVIGKSTYTPTAFVWNGSILRGISQNMQIFVSAHSNFRAPNIDDTGSSGIVDSRFEAPDINLQPEKSYNFQWGLKFKTKRWQSETYIYRNELRDIIARIREGNIKIQGYPLYLKKNIEKGFIQGVETAWTYRYTEGGSIEAAICYTYGQNLTKAEPIRRIPPFNARIGWHYVAQKWYLTLETLFADKQDRLAQGDKEDIRIPKGGTPGWVVTNMYGGFKYTSLDIRATLHNLLNVDYRTHGSGINGMGRALSLSLNWSF